MAEAKWYVVHTYSGYENKVKANIEKTIENNKHLAEQILEGQSSHAGCGGNQERCEKDRSQEDVSGLCASQYGNERRHMVCCAQHPRRYGLCGTGSKAVPLTEAEMKPLGIKTENVSIDFAEGDSIAVVAGVWKDTVGVVQKLDYGKQTATINVELFGRETPVEISFAEVRKL